MSTAIEGAYVRPPSSFREHVALDEPGRFHLYVSRACPWAHRTIIFRRLRGLENAIGISVCDPVRDERGWAFTGGEYVDGLNGFAFLSQAYMQTDPAYAGRISVPVLWDRREGRIVNNESSEIIRMLNAAGSGPDLCPEDLREEIDRVNERVYENLNDGVYRAGFATSQRAYEHAAHHVFETLAWLEERLERQRYLAGERITEADWRLFTTLVRFDSVYHGHFKCNLRRLTDHPNLWALARELYQLPGIAETVWIDEIKRHYYMSHPTINPSRIVPIGPELDFHEPHGRG